MVAELTVDRAQLVIGHQKITIPNHELIQIIGRGANGVAILARNEFLEETRVVKVWLSLRDGDTRDKFRQGIEEARKANRANGGNIVRIADAGTVDGLFYCVMDYFEAMTCHEWLGQVKPNLLTRISLCQALLGTNSDLIHRGLFHGDLHCNNLLISKATISNDWEVYQPNFRIIDFGTSIFSKPGNLKKRHWRVFFETVDRLLSPIRLRELSGPLNGPCKSPTALASWYAFKLGAIPSLLASLGVRWLLHPSQWSEIRDGKMKWPIEHDDSKSFKVLERLYRSGKLKLTPRTVGCQSYNVSGDTDWTVDRSVVEPAF